MKPDGGPAFPNPSKNAPDESDAQTMTSGIGALFIRQPGMSLRDAFAMAALHDIGLGKSGMSQEDIAALAYSIADAMLKERAK